MAKLGVGVGEDFPVDDGKPEAAENCPQGDWHRHHHHGWFFLLWLQPIHERLLDP